MILSRTDRRLRDSRTTRARPRPREHSIGVFFFCTSVSRAWGVPSDEVQGSDRSFDVIHRWIAKPVEDFRKLLPTFSRDSRNHHISSAMLHKPPPSLRREMQPGAFRFIRDFSNEVASELWMIRRYMKILRLDWSNVRSLCHIFQVKIIPQ